MELYSTISPIQEHACGTLAAMALRRPVNARAIIDAGGPRLIVTAMKRHVENVSVQRQGALAIRNIVSRLLKDLDDGDINITHAITLVSNQRNNMTQQHATVSALPLFIRIRKVLPYVPQCRRT